ncbi:uncharacterized protein [Miscanthus floridulus]|uniref:uncharacterized protein n=1 Tax=Miscanthus floridulus TaxID=154761 RepID=UPI003459FA16
MVGGTRKIAALYGKSGALGSASGRGRGKGGGQGKGRGKGKGKGARPPSPTAPSSSSEELPSAHASADEEELPSAHASADDEEVQEEQEQVEEALGSEVWLRGPSTLPRRPIPLERRPMVRPSGKKGWIKVSGGDHNRKVNGILGLLCRQNFPGLVQFREELQPAYTWDHYVAALDAADRDGRVFPNKAERVKGELWDFYRCQEGYEDKAASICEEAAKKLVKDMHYEARVQAIIDYYAHYRRMKVKKEEARTMNLTKEQFLQVPPYWCAQHAQCWEYMVDKWVEPGWVETHNACRDWRLLMPRASHHQGSLSLDEYREKWVREFISLF